MIQIKDLSIGNKIAGTGLHEGRVLTIRSIEHFEEEGFVLFFDEHDEGEFLRDCLPIPLTPQLLKEAHFKSKNVGPIPVHFSKGHNPYTQDSWITLQWSEKLGYFFYGNPAHPVRYVHQLQNLYRLLTGEDLDLRFLTHYALFEGKQLAQYENEAQ